MRFYNQFIVSHTAHTALAWIILDASENLATADIYRKTRPINLLQKESLATNHVSTLIEIKSRT